jgi:hypothetical protein
VRYKVHFVIHIQVIRSRLEGVNKLFGTHIAIDESVHCMLPDLFLTRKLGTVAVIIRVYSQYPMIHRSKGNITPRLYTNWWHPMMIAQKLTVLQCHYSRSMLISMRHMRLEKQKRYLYIVYFFCGAPTQYIFKALREYIRICPNDKYANAKLMTMSDNGSMESVGSDDTWSGVITFTKQVA